MYKTWDCVARKQLASTFRQTASCQLQLLPNFVTGNKLSMKDIYLVKFEVIYSCVEHSEDGFCLTTCHFIFLKTK